MRIICGGGYRSGSTWQYNAVRAIASIGGASVHGAWIHDYDPERLEAVHVVKAHHRSAIARFEGSLFVGGYRDLRDAAASLQRMGWAEARMKSVRDFLTHHLARSKRWQIRRFLDQYVANDAAWARASVHMMRYEDMIADPPAEIARLAKALGFALDAGQIAKVHAQVAAMRPPGDAPTGTIEGRDPETLLHPGHIGRGTSPLDPQMLRYIERRYAGWLAARGYPSARPPAS